MVTGTIALVLADLEANETSYSPPRSSSGSGGD